MAGTNVGVWATAPFLHNGSVPNLYQLLSPREDRYEKFCVGNLTFDPAHVGFVTNKPPCAPFHEFELNTNKIGNSNAGHEFKGCLVKKDLKEAEMVKKLIGRRVEKSEMSMEEAESLLTRIEAQSKKCLIDNDKFERGNGIIGPDLDSEERLAIIEFLKTLSTTDHYYKYIGSVHGPMG